MEHQLSTWRRIIAGLMLLFTVLLYKSANKINGSTTLTTLEGKIENVSVMIAYAICKIILNFNKGHT